MKRLTAVLTVALLAGMVLAGCSKEDEEKFTIMVKEIQLTVGESQKVETSGGFTAHSTDEDVATVTADGTITAVSAGEADVVFTSTEDATQQHTCHVTADWRYHYFDEPILDFSMNLEQLRERETHPLGTGNLWDAAAEGFPEATDPYLVRGSYEEQEIPMVVCYTFLDKQKGGIGFISLKILGNGNREHVSQQLIERYGSPSDYKSYELYFNKRRNCHILFNGGSIFYRKKPFE